MHLYATTPDLSAVDQAAVEVEVWEGNLLRNRTNIAKTLCTYSLDNGPSHETDEGKFLFRFTAFDWAKKIEELLTRSNIHYSMVRMIEINPLQQLLKKKIFVAEDDPDIAYCLVSVLEEAGYHVKLASSGKPIIEGNFSWVDLFILDKRMPDVDGLEICRYLRAQAATKDTPVIMISCETRKSNEALAAGANDYIEKPFHIHYLLNVVSTYMRKTTK
jgi:CheY-like chemotaxis protein